MSEIAELKEKVEEFVRAPKLGVLGVFALGSGLLLVGCFLPFLLATVPLLGLALVVAAALPLKWLLGKLLSPKWVGRCMAIVAIVLLTKPAILWAKDVLAMFPESKASAQIEPSKPAQPQPETLKPWYTDKKNCHLVSRQTGDTGQTFLGRSTCALSETTDLYCQCADYQAKEPAVRVAEIDYQRFCSVIEEISGPVTSRHERARYNRFDSASCRAEAARNHQPGHRFYCSCR